MKINLSLIDKSLLTPVKSALSHIGHEICDCGEKLIIEKGEKLSVNGFKIIYSRKNEIFRALSYLGEEIEETAKYKTLCYMLDASRNAVPNLPFLKNYIIDLALMGYNSLMLYTEDTFELENYKYFGHMRGRYSKEELKEIDEWADFFGIEVIPCVQTLAHLATALRWHEFDFKDTEDILMVGEEKTYNFVDEILSTCKECFKSKRVHIGMDEAHMLGRGNYLLKNGYEKPSDIMLKHLEKVTELCKKHDLSPIIWSDMFFRMAFGTYNITSGEVPESVRKKVPEKLALTYWDYYSDDEETVSHMLYCHKQFNNPVFFAGGAWKWTGFGAHNAYSLGRTKLALDMCEKNGVDEIIATGWGDDGCEASQLSNLPSLIYYAERCYGSHPSPEKLNSRTKSVFDISFDELMSFDLPDRLKDAIYENGDCLSNPSKYMLYNDPFERFCDCHVLPTASEDFSKNAEKLHKLKTHPTFGYAFETLSHLCKMLSKKCDLGIRLHKAYVFEDRQTLKEIANCEIPEILSELEEFTKSFRHQWMLENKSFGFTPQNYRLGGLHTRLLEISTRLNEYLNGEVSEIEELKTAPLPIFPDRDGKYIEYNNFKGTVSAGIL